MSFIQVCCKSRFGLFFSGLTNLVTLYFINFMHGLQLVYDKMEPKKNCKNQEFFVKILVKAKYILPIKNS